MNTENQSFLNNILNNCQTLNFKDCVNEVCLQRESSDETNMYNTREKHYIPSPQKKMSHLSKFNLHHKARFISKESEVLAEVHLDNHSTMIELFNSCEDENESPLTPKLLRKSTNINFLYVLDVQTSNQKAQHSNYKVSTNEYQHLDKCLHHHSEVLNDDPYNIKSLFQVGIILFRFGKQSEALIQLKKLLDLNQSNVDAINTLGDVYFQLNDYHNAKNQYEIAIGYRENFHSYYKLGRLQESLHDQESALRYQQECLEVTEKKCIAQNIIGNLYFNIEKQYKSVEQQTKALEFNKLSYEGQHNRGNVQYLKMKEKKKALIDQNKALKIKPGQKDSWMRKMELLKELSSEECKYEVVLRETEEQGRVQKWI